MDHKLSLSQKMKVKKALETHGGNLPKPVFMALFVGEFGIPAEAAALLFAKMDLNNNGFVSAQELKHFADHH